MGGLVGGATKLVGGVRENPKAVFVIGQMG